MNSVQWWCMIDAIAAEANRASGGSDREGSTIGTLAPMTTPAITAPAK